MALIIQDDGICSKHDVVDDRCRGPWKKSDVRPAELLTNADFLPLKIAKEDDFSPTETQWPISKMPLTAPRQMRLSPASVR
jgi:hypothetical protein